MSHTPEILPNGELLSPDARKPTGFLLSSDEIQLILNIASSLDCPSDAAFLITIAEKEFITSGEKDRMNRIFFHAAGSLRKEEETVSA